MLASCLVTNPEASEPLEFLSVNYLVTLVLNTVTNYTQKC